jgi:hypothetical protein
MVHVPVLRAPPQRDRARPSSEQTLAAGGSCYLPPRFGLSPTRVSLRPKSEFATKALVFSLLKIYLFTIFYWAMNLNLKFYM